MKRHYYSLLKYCCGITAAWVGLWVLFLALPLTSTDAQTLTTADSSREAELDAKIDTFFDALMRDNTVSAFDELLRGSAYGTPETAEKRDQLRRETDAFKEQFGAIVRWEKYETTMVGEDVLILRSILKYEQYPVMWTFTFYRKPVPATSLFTPGTNLWTIIALDFSTQLE